MRNFLLLAFFLLSFGFVNAQALNTYTYNGNGFWDQPAGWAGGVVPPTNSSGRYVKANYVITGTCTARGGMYFEIGSTITTKSNSVLNFQGSASNGPSELSFEGSKITIEPNSTITCMGMIAEMGKMQIDGTFNCAWIHDYGFYPPDSITITGQLATVGLVCKFDGPILVKTGGVLKNNPNNRIAFAGNVVTIESGGNFINLGILMGNGIIRSARFANSASLSPGNSPGLFSIDGDYEPTSSAKHNFEVAGTSSAQYDRLDVTGNIVLSGALNVSLLNGFTPSTAHDLPIITGANITGTFSTTNLPSSYTVVYNQTSVVLRSVVNLPVNFINVAAKAQANRIFLSWKVGQEVNVNRYVVESSTNGSVYKLLDSVLASSQENYQLSSFLPSQKTFYRIVAIDHDGRRKYSPVVVFANNKVAVPLTVYPNPASGLVTIQHEVASKDSRLFIYTLSGQLVKEVQMVPGMQQTPFDMSLLSRGVYTIRYQNSDGAATCSVTKQ